MNTFKVQRNKANGHTFITIPRNSEEFKPGDTVELKVVRTAQNIEEYKKIFEELSTLDDSMVANAVFLLLGEWKTKEINLDALMLLLRRLDRQSDPRELRKETESILEQMVLGEWLSKHERLMDVYCFKRTLCEYTQEEKEHEYEYHRE